MKRLRVGLWLVVVWGMGIPAQAAIYTWTDQDGVRHYSDTPTATEAPVTTLSEPSSRRLSSEKHGSETTSSNDDRAPADARALSLVRPRDGEQFDTGDTEVPIVVRRSTGPDSELKDGETLTYYLDDEPLPQSPTTAMRLSLANVAPGRHQLHVVLSYRGHEVQQSRHVDFVVSPGASSPDRTQAGQSSDGRPPS